MKVHACVCGDITCFYCRNTHSWFKRWRLRREAKAKLRAILKESK